MNQPELMLLAGDCRLSEVYGDPLFLSCGYTRAMFARHITCKCSRTTRIAIRFVEVDAWRYVARVNLTERIDKLTRTEKN